MDVIAFDNTNGHPQTYKHNYTVIAETIRKMRAEGTKLDFKFLFVTHGGEGGSPATMTWLYENFYRPGLYPELWYRWQASRSSSAIPTASNPTRYLSARKCAISSRSAQVGPTGPTR